MGFCHLRCFNGTDAQILVINGVNLCHVKHSECQTAVFSLIITRVARSVRGTSGVSRLRFCQRTSVLIWRDSSHSHLIFTAFTAAASWSSYCH